MLCILLPAGAGATETPSATPALVDGAETQPWWRNERLSGDWYGLRPRLAERGVDLNVVYTGDTFAVVAGGLHRHTAYLDDTDLTLTIDAEKLLAWPGASFFAYGLGNHGRDPSAALVGDTLAFDNIESPDTFKLYEAWYQQELLDARLSFLVGLYDLNGEFDVIETAQLFVNSQFGIGKDFSQSGLNGPSIFPVTSMALRAKIVPCADTYVQAVVLDGVPGSPRDAGGTQIVWDDDDGVLVAVEAGQVRGREAGATRAFVKYALGGWTYSTRLPRIEAEPVRERTGSFGLYGALEGMVHSEAADPAQGLALFSRLGYANAAFNAIEWTAEGGATYTGLLPGRDADGLGLAFGMAWAGDDQRALGRASGDRVRRAEAVVELTYRIQVLPWLAVQPDLQYDIHPGLNPAVDDALIVGSRFEVSF